MALNSTKKEFGKSQVSLTYLEAEPGVMPLQSSHLKLIFHLSFAKQNSTILKDGILHARFARSFCRAAR